MIKVNLVAIGKLKETFFTDAVSEYAKRISRFASFKVTELPERKTLSEEADDILKKASGLLVVFDVKGEEVTSEGLAKLIENAATNGKSEFTFVIGSSEGLDDKVKNAANKKISFGRVTYPHQLMRVIAAEQIYRAFTIINNVTYHK